MKQQETNIILGSAEDIIKKLRDDEILTNADINEGSVIYINGDKTDRNNKIDVKDYIGKKNIPSPADKLKLGDVVIYDPSEGVKDKSLLKYTSPIGSAKAGANVSGNGYSEQTIDASVDKITRWYVFKKEGNVVTLLSENPGKEISLKGGQGFLYAEQELHKLASVYGHGKYAKKIDNYTYTIGNPEPQLNELKTLNIRDLNTGARTFSLKDLEEMLGNPSIEQKKKLTEMSYKDDGFMPYYNESIKKYIYTTERPTEKVYLPTLSGVDETGKSADENKKSNMLYTEWCCNEGYELDEWKGKVFKSNTQWVAGRSVNCFKDSISFNVIYLTSKNMYNVVSCIGRTSSFSTDYIRTFGLRPVSTLDLEKADITKNNNGEWIIK